MGTTCRFFVSEIIIALHMLLEKSKRFGAHISFDCLFAAIFCGPCLPNGRIHFDVGLLSGAVNHYQYSMQPTQRNLLKFEHKHARLVEDWERNKKAEISSVCFRASHSFDAHSWHNCCQGLMKAATAKSGLGRWQIDWIQHSFFFNYLEEKKTLSRAFINFYLQPYFTKY